MPNSKFLLFLISIFLGIGSSMSQAIERQRPAEWDNLTVGGRYMDRYLPMHDGKTAKNIWGTNEVQGRYIDNGIESPEYSFWGGNILRGNDGKWHIFVAGWPESSINTIGHGFWPNSTVYHAISKNSYGPFNIVNTIGKGHNPEAFILKDGRAVVYVIDGYYIADSLNSPVWTYGRFSFNPRGRRIIEGLSNLSFAERQDGSYLMVCRGGGIWISQDGLTPYEQITSKRVYPAVDGRFEDPVIWRDSLQYHLIVNDWYGRIAYYERSYDGIHWIIEQGEAYTPGIAQHKDGSREGWFKYERAKVLQDSLGRVFQMNFAVIDTLKQCDKPGDRHSSKNICIPMNPGLQIEVLNTVPITSKTKFIYLRIKAENGFNPTKDLDIESLRFGSYNEVNFGRGAKIKKTDTEGNNLIVIFDGNGSGITSEEWAPKLIGKKKNGEMIYGYARLAYFDYSPAILSPEPPVIDSTTNKISVVVKNYGLKVSSKEKIELQTDNGKILSGDIRSLQPYDTCKVYMQSQDSIITKKWIVKIGQNTDIFNLIH